MIIIKFNNLDFGLGFYQDPSETEVWAKDNSLQD